MATINVVTESHTLADDKCMITYATPEDLKAVGNAAAQNIQDLREQVLALQKSTADLLERIERQERQIAELTRRRDDLVQRFMEMLRGENRRWSEDVQKLLEPRFQELRQQGNPPRVSDFWRKFFPWCRRK